MADDDDDDEDDEDDDEDDAPSIAPFASRFVDPSVRPSSSEVTKVKLHAERLASLHCVTLRSHRQKRGDDEEARDGNGKKMKVRGATSSSSRTLDVRARAHRVALLDATLKRETNLSKEWMEARDAE